MAEILTEKECPIRNIWLVKQLLTSLVVVLAIFLFVGNGILSSLSMLLFFFQFAGIFCLALSIPIIIKALQRSRFHYAFEDHFIVLHQGIISKQNRNVPYGRVQGIFVNQGLFDRVFGLASLTFEDYSQGGRSKMSVDGYVGGGKSRHEMIGFIGNKIHIPGLKKGDAETLKTVLLQKIKEHPIDDSNSGL